MLYELNKKLLIKKITNNIWHIYNPNTMRHYKVGKNEITLLESLKNPCTINEVSSSVPRLTRLELENIINQLVKINLVCQCGQSEKLSVNKLTKFYLLRIKTDILVRNNFTISYQWMLEISSLVSVMCIIYAYIKGVKISELIKYNTSVSSVLLLFIFTIITLIFHELSHGILAINQNAMVPEMGLLVYFMMPTGYADVTGIKFNGTNMQKLIVMLGGLLVNFCIVGISLFLWVNNIKNSIIASLILSNLGIIVFNLSFFIKLDGYYILELILHEDYLFDKSLKYVLDKQKKLNYEGVPRNEKIFYRIFGTLTIIFIPLLLGSIIFSFFRV
ncbi:hypothetical protein SN811_00510 [Ligilactobacillus agilis]|uniref:Peptidase M50 n=1 Tax=Ligilactobacillus agilis TaxID=1601 RepID=A0A6F9Y1W9_9LACO|nr:hypothetical protein [Ligilactobacillus agilis]GET11551.1 hypothetical protein SN811_00510 [Ligilactobacillus agilis]